MDNLQYTFLVAAERIDNGQTVAGYYVYSGGKNLILTGAVKSYPVDLVHPHLSTLGFEWYEIDPSTIRSIHASKVE